MSENTSDPGRIERDLGETRARLDGRLSELQERLSPGQILDDLVQYFRGSEGADFGRSLLDSVKGNPVPAAVTGIGLAWLMASNQRPQPAAERADAPLTPAAPSKARVRVSGAPDPARPAGDATSLAQRVSDTVGTAARSVSAGVASSVSAVAPTTHDLRDRAGDLARDAGEQFASGGQAAQDLGSRLAATLSENPVLLGALGLAAGALLGALVPQSREEEDTLGAVASGVRGTVRDAAQDAMDRGNRAAQAAVEAGRRSAGDHGFTGATSPGGFVDAALSGGLAGNAGEVAREALRAGHEAARDGLSPAGRDGTASPKS